jgi:uncharacterized protein DUF4404
MSDPDTTSVHLQQSLSKLHAELSVTPHVDDASRRMLRDVLADIERLLQDGPAAPQPSSPMPAASQSRLEALAVQFEADHPALSASLREFVDLLGRAGL